MSSGSAQDVVVEHFLRDIERRGKRLHCAVIGQEGQNSHGDMNLLYRKSRLDWRHRDSEGNKKSSSIKESSATVGKVRDLASFRRHFRMGFMTMPASQDLSPRPCSSAMAPRSQSCHSVGASGNGDDGDSLENGDHSSPQPPPHSAGRPPPTKPKRHPSTRLSAGGDHRAPGLPPPEAPPPPPPTQLPVKHSEKRNAMKKSDSGDVSGRKVPPIKPKRSPNTQLSFEPLPPRVPPPATPVPRPSQDAREDGGEDEEPVYIEMVGRAFSHRDGQNATPHPAADSDSDESEAIYEEMKYPLPEELEPRHRLPLKQDRPAASKPSKLAHSSSSHSSSSSLPHQASSSSSKPKAPVCASISSPLPSSSSSTPVPQSLGSGPQPQRAPTPYLLSGSKSQTDSTNKIPAPFPNLLQHRPPLLAFPHPAAASSGIGAQTKAAKLGSVSTQPAPASSAASSSTASTSSSSSKLPVLQLGGPKETSGTGGAQPEKQHSSEGKDPLFGPAPGLRARSHSTPLPPSSQSSHYGHYHHHHHHHHHHPSHYHHYRRADKDLPTSHSMKLGPQATAQTQTQSGGGGGVKEKEGKSVGFHLKSEKRERDREREAGTHSTTPTQSTSTSTTSNTGTSQPSGSSTPSPAPSSQPHSSSSQRPSSRPLLYRSHTPHFLSHGLPAYHPPPPDSPMLWTYPSAGLKRPPAYDSLRGGQLSSPHPHSSSKASSTSAPSQQGKAGSRSGQFDTGSLSRDGSGGGASVDEGSYWPMHRKLSFSHSLRETEKERDRAWNGSTDALSRLDKEEYGGLGEPPPGGGSGIPVRTGGGGSSGAGGFGDGKGGTPQSAGMRALGRSGLPLPCQTFPACHRNGELGRLSRSSSTSGVRQTSSNVQRQCSLPRDALSQSQTQSPDLRTSALSHQQQQLQLHQQHLHQQQLHQQLHLQLQYQHLTHLSQCQPPTSGGAATQTQRDGKLLEVIERKRCLCKEIKAHRRPERSLCKQDSMPILPSWRRTPEPRKTGTPPCQRQQAVVWDTAI